MYNFIEIQVTNVNVMYTSKTTLSVTVNTSQVSLIHH